MYSNLHRYQFSSVQSLSCDWLFATPWTAACQASQSITNSWSLLKLMSIVSVMPSNHFILCRALLLPPSVFPGIRVFSNESVLRIRWPKYWSIYASIGYTGIYSSQQFYEARIPIITIIQMRKWQMWEISQLTRGRAQNKT